MATIYVDSNASGAADGTSFTDAYASVKSFTPSAGDLVLVADNHSENLTVNLDLVPAAHTTDPTNPVRIVSVDTTNENFSSGAAINTADNPRMHEGVVWIGIDFTVASGDTLFGDADHRIPVYFSECTFTKNGSANFVNIVNESMWHFSDCTLTLNGTVTAWTINRAFYFCFDRCTFTGTMTAVPFTFSGGDNAYCRAEFLSCDFSGLSSLTGNEIWSMNSIGFQCHYENCRFPSGVTMLDRTDTNIGYAFDVTGLLSDDGSDTDPLITVRGEGPYGIVTEDTTRTISGGASDGTTAFSWRMTTENTAGPVQRCCGIVSPPIFVYVDGGSSTTVTIQIAHDAIGDGTAGALLDDEIWIRGFHPDTASPAFPAGGSFDSLPTAGGADVTSSSETWTGTGVGTEQELSVTFTPTEDGYVKLQVVFAPVDTTGVSVNVDPKPVVS